MYRRYLLIAQQYIQYKIKKKKKKIEIDWKLKFLASAIIIIKNRHKEFLFHIKLPRAAPDLTRHCLP